MKIFNFVFTLFAITTLMISCKSGKHTVAGFGGGFGASADHSNVDTSNNKFNQSQHSISEITAVLKAADHATVNRSKDKRKLFRNKIAVSKIKELKSTTTQQSIFNILKKSAPAQTNDNGSGGAIFILLLFIAIIIWALVKLAGFSIWKIILFFAIFIVSLLLLGLIMELVENSN